MARKVAAVVKAHGEQVRGVTSGSRMLANRSFRSQIAALLMITETSAENLIGYALTLAAAFPKTFERSVAGRSAGSMRLSSLMNSVPCRRSRARHSKRRRWSRPVRSLRTSSVAS
jgi:hypothetical protein